MIVMKFGDASVESRDAIARWVGTVNSHLAQRPVVVVSAFGKTTNRLLEFAEHARRGELYLGSKCLTELQDYHFEVAGQVANGEALHRLESSLQRSFRDLRVILSEVADEGREVTPALLDEIASFGERMSSEIVAAALQSGGIPSVHIGCAPNDSHGQPSHKRYAAVLGKLCQLTAGDSLPKRRPGGGHGWLYRLHE
jgi:aspartate kinase